MAMRRIAMCEQAGTGMRMMREEWQKMGHPEPTYNNDRAWKAFEFFIPELDKEVDMASDLMKAMFGRTDQVTGEVTGEVQRLLAVMKGEMKRQEIQAGLGLKHEDHFREKYLKPAMAAAAIEMTIPNKPRSSKQKYRLTEKGRKLIGDSGPNSK